MAEETKIDKTPRKYSLRNLSLKKLNRKYDFLMSHDETGRPMLNFRLNLLNLIWVILGLVLLLAVITTFIIAFTPSVIWNMKLAATLWTKKYWCVPYCWLMSLKPRAYW